MPTQPVVRNAAALRVLLLLVVSFAIAGCASDPTAPHATHTGSDVELLDRYLTGTFDSVDQAGRAPDDFFEIRLVMVPVWPERTDGPWLYVEQAAMSSLDRPYRQRVYRLSQDGPGAVRSDIYTLPDDPLTFTAAWKNDTPLGDITPDDLDLRDGCSIFLTRTGDEFVGSTRGDGCVSTLRGSAYATSEVEVGPRLLVSWDRGWDAEGEQAWGATAGGYEFVKRSQSPPFD